jgi:hypothetical protein
MKTRLKNRLDSGECLNSLKCIEHQPYVYNKLNISFKLYVYNLIYMLICFNSCHGKTLKKQNSA